MTTVMFVCASESSKVPDRLRNLRSAVFGHVEILQPPAYGSADAKREWLSTEGARADVVVVCLTGSAVEAEPVEATEPSRQSQSAQAMKYLRLTADERAALPDRQTILVAIGASRDEPLIPSDLQGSRRFDLSTSDGYDALVCRLVHEPLLGAQPSSSNGKGWEAGAGAARVVMGLVATLVGNQDQMRDFLVGALGDSAWIVHYAMVLIVLVLIATGLASVLRAALQLAKPILSTKLNAFLELSGRWKPVALALAVVLSLGFARVYFPGSPSVDAIVSRHLDASARRLTESLLPSGAFREHHDQGVGQAWMSAQALAGLLSTKPSALQSEDYRRAFAFLQRARIGDFAFNPNTRVAMAVSLKPVLGTIDVARLPAKVPSRAFAFDVMGLMTGTLELPRREVERLDRESARYFDGTFNNQGWGYFEQFDWGVTEIAGWVGVATAASLRVNDAAFRMSPEQSADAKETLRSIVALLRTRQIPGVGGFSPIADVSRPEFVRTYSTVMALWAMAEATSPELHVLDGDAVADVNRSMQDAVRWLGRTAVAGGWKENPGNPTKAEPFLGLASQALFVVERVRVPIDQTSEEVLARVRQTVLRSSRDWLRRRVNVNDRLHDSDRYLFPTSYVTEGSTFLWYPWTLALMRALSLDSRPDRATDSDTARQLYRKLRARAGEFGNFAVEQGEYNYVAAEGLIGFSWPTGRR